MLHPNITGKKFRASGNCDKNSSNVLSQSLQIRFILKLKFFEKVFEITADKVHIVKKIESLCHNKLVRLNLFDISTLFLYFGFRWLVDSRNFTAVSY